MNPVIRNILAVLAGFAVGSIVNLGLIQVGGIVIPPPPGVDSSSMESVRESMHLMEARHFLFPFLAHALGALVGAAVATVIAASHRMRVALLVGCFFLLGGIAASMMLPAPAWYMALDLVLAYIPMAWLGWRIAEPGAAARSARGSAAVVDEQRPSAHTTTP